MHTRRNYSGWTVVNRDELLAGIGGATFDNVIAEHITYRYPDSITAPPAKSAVAVAHIVSAGVECVVVEIDGNSQRPDGGTFHVTISLTEGRRPVESNNIITDTATATDIHIPLELVEF